MVLTAPQVDVVPDAFDWWNAAVGLGGLVAAVAALFFALRAQRAANTAVTEERRRVFELDILRDLVKVLDETDLAARVYDDPGLLRGYALRLKLITSPLPFWQRVMDLRDTSDVIAVVGMSRKFQVVRDARESHEKTMEMAVERYRDAGVRLGVFDPKQRAEGEHPAVLKVQAELLPHYAQTLVLLNESKAAQARLNTYLSDELSKEAVGRLSQQLSYDLEQAILERVESRPQRRPRWWYRV